MSIHVAFRIAITLTAGGIKVLRWVDGPGVATLDRRIEEYLGTTTDSDEEASAKLSEHLGRLATVATYSDTFELRKLQAVWSRSSGAATPEDKAVATWHFIKLTAAAPDATWIASNFTTIESAFQTMWAVMDDYYKNYMILDELRWYRTGPQRDIELGAPGRTGPPVRVLDVNLPGVDASSEKQLPPQCAVSVTEITSSRKAWGRFYLPAPMANALGSYGRFNATLQGTWGDAIDAFYEACRTANTPVVVYSPAKPERVTKANETLPAQGARALTVDTIQLDDVMDVIRSRRWDKPLLRLQRAIG